MRLLSLLRSLGDRLHILEAAPDAAPAEPVKIRMRSITLPDLVTEIRGEEVRRLARQPGEQPMDFGQIFQTAGISPPAQGWTLERLQHLLRTDHFKNLDKREAQRSLAEILRSEHVDPQDLVQQAVAQDRALDEFERSMHDRRAREAQAARQRQGEIESKIEDLTKQREQLEAGMKEAAAQWQDWLKRKRSYERELAAAVGFLIDTPLISVDEGEEGS